MPDIKTTLFQAASEAFKDGEVSVKLLTPDHPKLARRDLTENQISVRVVFTENVVRKVMELKRREGEKDSELVVSERATPTPYAVAGFVPESAKPEDVNKLIVRLKLDRIKYQAALHPAAVA